LKAGFTSRVSELLNPSVVQETPAIEDNLFDAEGAGALANRGANRLCLGRLVFSLDLAVEFWFKRRRRGERPTHGIVDNLSVDVLKAAKDRKTRTLRGSTDLSPHAVMPPHPLLNIRKLRHSACPS